MEKLKEHKYKIFLGLSIMILAIVLIAIASDNGLKPSNVGAVIENTEKDVIEQKTYPKFNGEEIDFQSIMKIELNNDENNGLTLFMKKTPEDVINAFTNSTKELKFTDRTTSIEENIKFNSLNGDIIESSLMRSLVSSNEESDEKLEVSFYTNGGISEYIYNLIVDIRAEDWKSSNKILESFLDNLNIEDNIKESILKSNEDFENIKYTNSENEFTINIKRNNKYCCNTSLIITHTADKLDRGKVTTNKSFENMDSIAKKYGMVNSSNYEYSFEFNNSTFGNDVIATTFKVLNKECAGSISEVTFKGIKGDDGTIYNEEFHYKNYALSSDKELEIVVASNYLNGSISNELDINSEKEAFTDEEKELCKKIMIDFLDIVDENCEVKDTSELDGAYSKNTINLTDINGNPYTITYGEIDNAFMINHAVEGYNNNIRSSDFKTYK